MTDRNTTLWLMIIAFVLVVCAAKAFGATEIKCAFTSCVVHGGQLSLCGGHEVGSVDAMKTAEVKSRGEGSLFLRECILSPADSFQLKWDATGGMFKKKDTQR